MVEIGWDYERKMPLYRKHEVKSVKHYDSNHQILLVGEGDFSFSLSLAVSFGSATNIVATSLDSYDLVIKKYKRAETNLEILDSYGARLLHGVDAMKMNLHTDLHRRKFDRIIYNFPHAGFLGSEADQRVIVMHKNLVLGFFKNASRMLHPDGEIHVSHKTTNPFNSWNIKQLAAQNSLGLLEIVEFKIQDYPGYNNKRGDGKNPDNPFPLGECSTFKFITSSHRKFLQQPQQEVLSQRSKCFLIFKEYFEHALSTFGQGDRYLSTYVQYLLDIGFERCKAENHVDPVNEYVNLLKELQKLSNERIVFLQNLLV